MVYKMPRELSDHNHVILTVDADQPLKKLSFEFELSWLKHPEFLVKVQDLWTRPCHVESAFDKIQSKLKRFKQYLKGRGFNAQGEAKKRKEHLRGELTDIEQME
jgi:hypothetical protein